MIFPASIPGIAGEPEAHFRPGKASGQENMQPAPGKGFRGETNMRFASCIPRGTHPGRTCILAWPGKTSGRHTGKSVRGTVSGADAGFAGEPEGRFRRIFGRVLEKHCILQICALQDMERVRMIKTSLFFCLSASCRCTPLSSLFAACESFPWDTAHSASPSARHTGE